MEAYKLSDDYHEWGYFKTPLGVAKAIANNEEVFSQWFDSYEDYLDLIERYEIEKITWEEYTRQLQDYCIYIEKIEIIED